jgi:hypothetical protein
MNRKPKSSRNQKQCYVVESDENENTEEESSVEGNNIDPNALPKADDTDESSEESNSEFSSGNIDSKDKESAELGS